MELHIEKEHSASCSPPQNSFSEANFIENGFELPPDALTKDDETGEVKRASIDGFTYYRYNNSVRYFQCNCSHSSLRLNSDYTHHLPSGAHTAVCLKRAAKKQPERPPDEDEIDDNDLEKDEKTGEIKAIHWDGKRWRKENRLFRCGCGKSKLYLTIAADQHSKHRISIHDNDNHKPGCGSRQIKKDIKAKKS